MGGPASSPMSSLTREGDPREFISIRGRNSVDRNNIWQFRGHFSAFRLFTQLYFCRRPQISAPGLNTQTTSPPNFLIVSGQIPPNNILTYLSFYLATFFCAQTLQTRHHFPVFGFVVISQLIMWTCFPREHFSGLFVVFGSILCTLYYSNTARFDVVDSPSVPLSALSVHCKGQSFCVQF